MLKLQCFLLLYWERNTSFVFKLSNGVIGLQHFSKAYIAHNATQPRSEIPGGSLSDYMQLPLEPQTALCDYFHICSSTPQDLSTHSSVYYWWSYPLDTHVHRWKRNSISPYINPQHPQSNHTSTTLHMGTIMQNEIEYGVFTQPKGWFWHSNDIVICSSKIPTENLWLLKPEFGLLTKLLSILWC